MRGPVRFSGQNLNDHGSAWRQGRCWVWSRTFASAVLRRVFEVEWSHFRKFVTDFALEWHWWPAVWYTPPENAYQRALAGTLSATQALGGRRKVRGPRWQVHVAGLGCSWWFGLPDHDSWALVTGITLFGDHLGLHWRHDDVSCPPDRGWYRSWFLLDKLLGRAKYGTFIKCVREVVVPMPERAYRGVCTLHRDTWKRPRWPFVRRIERATIDMAKGEQIPFPGKGENAWDCGEDATYSLTTPASSVPEVIGKMVESVLARRERHGGSVNWRPAPPSDADLRYAQQQAQ